MKALKRTHIIILLLCLIPLLIGLVWFIIRYDSLPNPMGIHFGFDEKTHESIFDVIDNKIFRNISVRCRLRDYRAFEPVRLFCAACQAKPKSHRKRSQRNAAVHTVHRRCKQHHHFDILYRVDILHNYTKTESNENVGNSAGTCLVTAAAWVPDSVYRAADSFLKEKRAIKNRVYLTKQVYPIFIIP